MKKNSPKKEIKVKITGGKVIIASYCLRTDSWQDYLAFVSDAETAIRDGDLRTGNRYLRAALTCLFAHLEGVVNAVTDKCEISGLQKFDSLCNRTRKIGNEAKKLGSLPYLNFKLEKVLRDLIAHPGIEKAFGDETLDQEMVFERLDLETIRQLGNIVGNWLDAVCKNLGVDRFTDTKAEVESVRNLFGGAFGSNNVEITEV